MFTIKTLNAISPVGLAKLNKNLFDVSVDADAPDGILFRSADLLNTTFNDNLLAIAIVRDDLLGHAADNVPTMMNYTTLLGKMCIRDRCRPCSSCSCSPCFRCSGRPRWSGR